MKLELRQAFVRDVQWGEKTQMKEGVLFIDKADALSLLAEEKRFTHLDMDLARPGESVRIIPVKDVIEPRCKLEGKGECFPGFIGGSETVGNGATLVLKGAAVVTVGPIVSIQEGLVDMSGPGTEYNPYGATCNVCLLVQPAAGIEKKEYETALREAGIRLAWYIADKCRDAAIDRSDVYEMADSVEGKAAECGSNLPRFVYVCQAISQGLLHDTFLYGVDVKQILPTLVQPQEIMDGAMISANCVSACDKQNTFHHQNNPVVMELCKRHGKDLNFLGVIVTTEMMTLVGKIRSSEYTVKLAQMLGAQVAIITEEGCGNPDTDICMNAKNLELAGIKTVVIGNEVAGQNGASQGLADVTPEMNAYVSCGNINELVELPPMKKIIGDIRAIANVSGGDEKSIGSDGTIVCEIQSIIGSTNELGCSKIGCEWI